MARLTTPSNDVMYCQTGGWTNNQCSHSAVATMASINAAKTVTPDNVSSDVTSVTVNGTKRTCNYPSVFPCNGSQSFFSRYTLSSETALLNAIKAEIFRDRAVVVKTTGAGQHWVTVTKVDTTKSGFAQLYGIDPWYNGSKVPPNLKTGTGTDSTNSNKSGVIQLINGVKNSNGGNPSFHTDLRIFTYNAD